MENKGSTKVLKLTLEQFGCYRFSYTVSFSGPGIALLQGISGVGKTTLFEALQYALYGKPKRVSWGERSCRVSIEFEDWVITRTGTKSDKTGISKDAKPTSKSIPATNSLTLVDTHLDKTFKSSEAQSIIDQRFGTNFPITSYITQKAIKSFFSLSPAHRIEFLEKLASGNTDITELKKQLSGKISERKKVLYQKVGELKFTSDEAVKYPEPKSVSNPLEKPYTLIRAKNARTQLKNNDKELKAETASLADLSTKQSTALHHNERREHLETEQSELVHAIKSLDDQISSIPSADLKPLEEQLIYLRTNNELVKLRTTRDQEEQQYRSDIVIEKHQLQIELDDRKKHPTVEDRSAILRSESVAKNRYRQLEIKIKELNDELEELDTVENYSQEITRLNTREQALITAIAVAKVSATARPCPHCHTYLRFVNDSFIVHTESSNTTTPDKGVKELEKELKSIRSNRKEYEELLDEAKHISSQLDLLKKEMKALPSVNLDSDYETLLKEHLEELSIQKTNQDRINHLQYRLDNHVYDSRIQALGRRVDESTRKIKALEKTSKSSAQPPEDNLASIWNNPELLQAGLETGKIKKQQRENLLERRAEKTARAETLIRKIADIPVDSTDYTSLVEAKRAELEILRKAEKSLRERVSALDKYEAYLEKHKTWDEWSRRLRIATENESAARRSLTTAERFMTKIKENESVSVINLVDNINLHLAHFADRFFSDPISVEITTFKESKEGEKPTVDISVFYKGAPCKVEELSGGEQARLELAICLAINALGSGSLLLLDECFSSLDSETTEDIVELLKKHALEQNKLIITIAHQVSEGCFDSVMTL